MSYSTALVHTVAVKLRRVLVLLPEAGKPIVDGLRSAIQVSHCRLALIGLCVLAGKPQIELEVRYLQVVGSSP